MVSVDVKHHVYLLNDFCIKMGSDESRFNVSLIVRDKVARPCPQTTSYKQTADEIIYPSLHCHPQNDSCIKMGSDESHILKFYKL